ncbi:MAG: purine-binding chemotaxis protein CheW [bacterium]|nr:purine-binding chemotaxis protein CheW [bacterium]
MTQEQEYAADLDDELGDDFYEDAQKDRFMTFEIADQNYGVDIMHVTEIVGLQDIAVVPDVPHFVKGMINLRGNVVPVIDVRLRFGMQEGEYDDRTCVIVVTLETSTIGMIVDRVNEVRVIPEDHISPPPQGGVVSMEGQYITGLGREGEEVTVLLDLVSLLNIQIDEFK